MSKKNWKQTILLWTLTIFVTLASVVYQRLTGPTHPVRGKVEITGETLKYKLLRSHEVTADAKMEFAISDTTVTGVFKWRRYKSHDEWTSDTLKVVNNKITVAIPKQPAAGKVMYQITLVESSSKEYQLTEEPIVIRFKGAVPGYVLSPHILFMFIAMLLATRTGLEAIANRDNTFRLAFWTAGLLFAGGLILGPIVQKFAFDAFWTGWPFGHDVTDTKTLVAFIFWGIALWRGRQPGKGRGWFVIAAVVTLLVYLVPHSVLGSEIDYTAVE
ncbi:hypothetical protein H8E88_30925 [candidate division KSB1 bacterium]|nr:hypothetical protein [candidate division KSB1 bacterium]